MPENKDVVFKSPEDKKPLFSFQVDGLKFSILENYIREVNQARKAVSRLQLDIAVYDLKVIELRKRFNSFFKKTHLSQFIELVQNKESREFEICAKKEYRLELENVVEGQGKDAKVVAKEFKIYKKEI